MEAWMPYFIAAITAAVIIQTIIMIAMGVAVLKLSKKLEAIASDVQGRVNPIISRVQTTIEEIQPKIAGLIADVADVTRMARAQAQNADRFMSDGMDRMRSQLNHVDQILTGTLETVEDTGTKIKRTVMAPVRSVSAVLRGIQTGLDFYRGRNRQVDGFGEQQDDSLFI